MALHVFGNIVTPFGTAANNRGETEGNITTLQKLIWYGAPHTTVSAEAIRFAFRKLLAASEERGTNRRWDEVARTNVWQDHLFESWAGADEETFIDDDLLGFMRADAAKAEAGDGSASTDEDAAGGSSDEGSGGTKSKKGKKKAKAPKGTATVRRAVLEVCRAVSLTPWHGDLTFNAASPGATASAQKHGSNPVPYGTEVHATRYQYGFALTPEALRVPSRAEIAIRCLSELGPVAGNHGRFLFDFSPDSIVLRITHDPSPRLLYCFTSDDNGKAVDAPTLLSRVETGDIPAKELVIGGPLAQTPTGKKLIELGATTGERSGVKQAAEKAIAMMREAMPNVAR